MNRDEIAETLRSGIVAAMERFRQEIRGEVPYAFALIAGTEGLHCCAVATEQGLIRHAVGYHRRGYSVVDAEDDAEHVDLLAEWLRWSDPDEGWYLNSLDERFDIERQVNDLINQEKDGDEPLDLEEFCTEVLASLHEIDAWSDAVGRNVVVGFTSDQTDPRHFLRTATRCNPYPVVKQLWSEYAEASELAYRVESPGDGDD